jgi:hypothetical protein
MKSLVLAFVLAFSILSPNVSQARSDEYTIDVPYELSCLLISDQYIRVLKDLKSRNQGKFLRISSITRFDIGEHSYLDVGYEVRTSTDFHWKPLGSITSEFRYGSMGLVELISVFYKPAVEFPGGGASVGNN